jgi:CLIP-associating protein 1/2
LRGTDLDTQLSELKRCTVALEDGSADVKALKKLALICLDNPVDENLSSGMTSFSFPTTPPAVSMLAQMKADQSIWGKERIFHRMLDALLGFLTEMRV